MSDIPAAGMTVAIKLAGSFTVVPNASEIEMSGFKVAERNPTGLTSGRVRKKPGLPNYGDLKFKIWFDPNDTTHQALRDRAKSPSQTLDDWKVVYADGMVVPANAIVKGFVSGFDFKSGDAEKGTNEVDVTVAVDDITSFTAGAAS